jgi:hypothetical protein
MWKRRDHGNEIVGVESNRSNHLFEAIGSQGLGLLVGGGEALGRIVVALLWVGRLIISRLLLILRLTVLLLGLWLLAVLRLTVLLLLGILLIRCVLSCGAAGIVGRPVGNAGRLLRKCGHPGKRNRCQRSGHDASTPESP